MPTISPYVTEQIQQIRLWKTADPSVLAQGIERFIPTAKFFGFSLIPEKPIRKALLLSQDVMEKLVRDQDLLDKAQVENLAELRQKDLEICDSLAGEVQNWAIALGTAKGGIAGYLGAAGTLMELPALTLFSLRTLFKLGLCYGNAEQHELTPDYLLSIVAIATANSKQEREDALEMNLSLNLRMLSKPIDNHAALLEKFPSSLDMRSQGFKHLAHRIVLNMGKRKAIQSVPALAMVVGAGVNAWFLRELTWAARRVYQERWLLENNLGQLILSGEL